MSCGGKSISQGIGSLMKINPDIPEAAKIRGWYDNVGCKEQATNISARGNSTFAANWMSLADVAENNLGNNDRGDYFQMKATILHVKSENAYYKACPSDNCNKKVVDMENGTYRCEKCNMEFPEFKYRLLGSVSFFFLFHFFGL